MRSSNESMRIQNKENAFDRPRANSVVCTQEFINRLVYEYEDKKIQLDINEKKIKPVLKLNPNRFAANLEREHLNGDVIDDILRRGEEMATKKQMNLDAALMKEKKIISENLKKSQPNPRSREILQEATEKAIMEMYIFLLAGEEIEQGPDNDEVGHQISQHEKFQTLSPTP